MQINVNGQSYTRWEDVPADVRQQLAATLPDADKNGVPDLLEGNLAGLPTSTGALQTFTSISVNGQTVGSVAELPPEVREALHQAFGWAAPMFGQPPAAAQPPAPGATPGATVPPAPTAPILPGQVMLNGVPTTVGDAPPEKKSWWRRLFGA